VGALHAKFQPTATVILAALTSPVAREEPTLRAMLACAGNVLVRGAGGSGGGEGEEGEGGEEEEEAEEA
jgi:hypothetical protein